MVLTDRLVPGPSLLLPAWVQMLTEPLGSSMWGSSAEHRETEGSASPLSGRLVCVEIWGVSSTQKSKREGMSVCLLFPGPQSWAWPRKGGCLTSCRRGSGHIQEKCTHWRWV